MTQLTKLKGSEHTLQTIGDKALVVCSSHTTIPPTLNNGTYLLSNTVYSQEDYPELYEKIGLHEVGVFMPSIVVPNTSSGSYACIAYGNGVYVYSGVGAGTAAGTTGIYTSNDSVTWTYRVAVPGPHASISYGNGLFVYGGNGGVVGTSTDGITWTARTSGTTSEIYTLTYGNGLFVYGGSGGVLSTSTNGITWTARTSGTTSEIYALTYGNGLFVYGGESGILSTSTNGITWTARTSGTTSDIYALTYGNGLYVIGAGHKVLTTTNFSTINEYAVSSEDRYVKSIAFKGGRFVAATVPYTISISIESLYTSTDAVNWAQVEYTPVAYNPSIPATTGPKVIATDSLFLVTGVRSGLNGGIHEEVYSSTDAISLKSLLYDTSTEFIIPDQYKYDPTTTNVGSTQYRTLVYVKAKDD